MHHGDQRGKFIFFDVLKFVHEYDESGACDFRRLADAFEQRLQIVLEIAIVSDARFGVVVDAHFYVVELDLQALYETGQSTKCFDSRFLCDLQAADCQQRDAQLWSEHRWKGPALRRFDASGDATITFCVQAHFVQQYGFANAAQTDQHGAFGGTTSPYPGYCYTNHFAHVVAPG